MKNNRLTLKCVVTNNKPTIINNVQRNQSYGHLGLDKRVARPASYQELRNKRNII